MRPILNVDLPLEWADFLAKGLDCLVVLVLQLAPQLDDLRV